MKLDKTATDSTFAPPLTLAVMQSYFFPYLGYFQLIAAADKILLYERVDFRKKTWITRNRILIKNKGPAFIQVPLRPHSNADKMSDVRIASGRAWKTRFLNTLGHNYKGSPFFGDVYPVLENLLDQEHEYLHGFNAAIIKTISAFLGIETPIVSDNARYLDLEAELERDYAGRASETAGGPAGPAKKTMRIIKICRAEKAGRYINPIGGTKLYDKNEFARFGVTLNFLKTGECRYRQFGGDFCPDLSIIDVLMHNGREKTRRLIRDYSLI